MTNNIETSLDPKILNKDITIERVIEWLVSKLSETLEMEAEMIDTEKPFAEYGLDSMAAVGVTGELEDWLEIEVPATLLWDYPNINSISEYLFSDYLNQRLSI